MSYAIRLEVWKRGLVLATDAIWLEEDGRIKCWPCSIVRFSDDATTATTVRTPFAYFSFDPPIASISDMRTSKLVAIECANGVRITLDNQ
jgi:hypothetical protein